MTLRSVLLLVMLVGFSWTNAVAQTAPKNSDDDTAEIKKFLDQWAAEFVQGDTDSIMAQYVDRADLRVVFSSGRAFSRMKPLREEYASTYKLAEFQTSEFLEPLIRRRGDVAWIHARHRAVVKDKESGVRFQLEVYTTLVLEKLSGKWKIVLEHSSPIDGVPRIKPLP